jgi:hypothetical protein
VTKTMTINIKTELYNNTEYIETQTPIGSWDESIDKYVEFEPPSKWWARITYSLFLVGAFLLGRAYGWYEVHLFIKHNAEGLAALAGTLK